MNRNMILPATIAAGLHVLLLGFKPSPPKEQPPVVTEKSTWRPSAIPIVPEDPEFTPAPSDDPLPPQPPGAPVPRGEVVPSLNPRDYLTPTIFEPPTPYIPGENRADIPSVWGGPSGLPDGVVDKLSLDNDPRVVFRHAPVPPRSFNDPRATVVVEFIVGKDGRVINAQVIESTNSTLDEVCLRAVRRWKFEPGLKRNVPVAFRVRQDFVFNTNN
jgi:protein TonB